MRAGGEHLADPDHGGVGPPGTGTGVHVVVFVARTAGQEVQPAVAPRQRQDETARDHRVRDGRRRACLGVGRRHAVRDAARQEGTVAAPLSHLQQGLQGQVLGERAHTHAHRRKAVHVQRLRQEFQAKGPSGQTPAHAHHARQTAAAARHRPEERRWRRRWRWRRWQEVHVEIASGLIRVRGTITDTTVTRPYTTITSLYYLR